MSKYMDKVQNGIKAAGEDKATLIGSNLLVEIVQRERKTSSGIYLGDKPEGKELLECIILATGAGYYDEEEGDLPLDTKIGDIVYVEPMNVRKLYDFPVKDYTPNTIGLIDEAQILFRFRGKEAVTAFRVGAGIDA